MARMWPESIPSWVSSDSRRSAEIEVYQRLRDTLQEQWEVFYSRPWWGINNRGGEVDGEADFILAHPDKGFLFIEVKGGRVEYDPLTSRWTSKDRNGIVFNIKDPVSQALACKHRYIDRLRNIPGWPHKYIRFRHGVVFPDSDEKGPAAEAFGGYDRSLFCLSTEFESGFNSWVHGRLSAHVAESSHTECPPGEAPITLLRNLIADPVRLHLPLKRILNAESAQLENLVTAQQLHLIGIMDNFQKAVIEGGAGTGKTLLALEMAYRLAESGKQVCLLAYNAPISEWMKDRLANVTGVTVGTFHSICGRLVSAAHIHCHGEGEDFYRVELPRATAKVLENKPDLRWDAVLVDEGQDFLDDWWSVVERMIVNPDGLIRVFYDSNQSVYRNSSDVATIIGAQTFTLKHNLRNTKAIARVTDGLYRGPHVFALGPDGTKPVVTFCTYAESLFQVRKLILDLIKLEKILPGDIAVLMPGESEASKFRVDLGLDSIQCSGAEGLKPTHVVVDSIKRFKGLESAIIILVVNKSVANDAEIAYVAVSRAKCRLYFYGNLSDTRLSEAIITGDESTMVHY